MKTEIIRDRFCLARMSGVSFQQQSLLKETETKSI